MNIFILLKICIAWGGEDKGYARIERVKSVILTTIGKIIPTTIVNTISPAVGPLEGVALGVGARVVTPGGIAARGVKLQEPCVNMMSSMAISPL